MAPELTADEYALYDRQVRLWGAQAQPTIGQDQILIISLRALGTEICKNLTLAGIGSITIIDDALVTEDDLSAGYFFREADIGKPRTTCAIPRIQELNPRVSILAGSSFAQFMALDPNELAQYSLIVACDLDFPALTVANAAARVANRPFYAAGIHGEFGFIFADLIDHTFTFERDFVAGSKPATIGSESTTRSTVASHVPKAVDGKSKEIVTKRELYCPLLLANSSSLDISITRSSRRLKKVPALLAYLRALFSFQREVGRTPLPTQSADLAAFTTYVKLEAEQLGLPAETLDADSLRSFISALGTEIPPTASFIGSRLSEDIINAVTHREQPIQNIALFDGEVGPIYCLYTTPPVLHPVVQPVQSNGIVHSQIENGTSTAVEVE